MTDRLVFSPRPGRRPPPPPPAGSWEHSDGVESDGGGGGGGSPLGGRRQGTKRGFPESASPPTDQRNKRGRRAPDGGAPEDPVRAHKNLVICQV